ncbi:hypothetical protein I553_6868 [Mycobacterium xenopi 4042]|uniref:Uncharacterized protein n=1 Tax=Mycobacterium xenopi 4042 TaxID=1299334 RepID=X7Z328_MYCXE|nr:hypothetical protein I553_6868 [Mycobacterium xenopi 4042]EUA33686.1 hypothetical protein I552_4465 [Mycobacterium xenopi 3993]
MHLPARIEARYFGLAGARRHLRRSPHSAKKELQLETCY